MTVYAHIIGTGSAAPEKVLTNFDLEKMVETSDQWITARTGIKRGHLAENGVASSDLATEAAGKALAKAGLRAEDIDLILLATVTPDQPLPSTACLVQHKLCACNAAVMEKTGLSGDDIDLMIPHQANIRIIDSAARRLGIPMDRVYVNIQDYGNTSAASIAIALDEAIEKKRICKGDRVLLVAFGAGFTWGSVIVEF